MEAAELEAEKSRDRMRGENYVIDADVARKVGGLRTRFFPPRIVYEVAKPSADQFQVLDTPYFGKTKD